MMSTILHVPNPDRQLTDVEVRGWPIVISTSITFGAFAVPSYHRMNITNRHEVHISKNAYDDLTLNLFAWPQLEREVEALERIMKKE